jgi:Cytochrome P450
MLSEHPDIEKRLRQEIYDKVGQTARPTYDQMREMKYMRAFLNGMYFFVTCVLNLLTAFFCGRGTKTVSSCVSSLSLSFSHEIHVDVCPCSPSDSRYIH